MAENPNKKMREANTGLTVIQGGKPNWTGIVRVDPRLPSDPAPQEETGNVLREVAQ